MEKLIYILLIVLLLTSGSALANETNEQIQMKITYPDSQVGELFSSETSPLKKAGELYLPLRSVCEKLKAEVVWNEADGTATVTKRGSSFTPDEFVIENGRMYVKSDVIKNFFSVEITEDTENNAVVFNTGKDYYAKWQQQENTQFKLELYGDDKYPDYLAQEAANTIFDIQTHPSKNLASIAFITDFHYTPTANDSLALTRAVNTYKDIASKVETDGIVLGGDYLCEGSKEARLEIFKEFRSHFEGTRYFPVNGNHDDGYIWDNVYIQLKEDINHFDRPDMYKALYDHLPGEGAVLNEKDPEALYYYFDNTEKKVRYIVLDGHNYVDENGTVIKPGLGGMGQKQMDWLANEALKFDEEGWTVLVFMHMMQKPETSTTAHTRTHYAVRMVLDAYKAGTSISGIIPEDETVPNRVECNYDFSNYKRAEIAGLVAGHWHIDLVEYTPGGIPYIFTEAFVENNKHLTEKHKRIAGTKSEILFDVISIDTNSKMLYISRVGSGLDRRISYK